MKKWYVVYRGRVPGVYDEWEHCSEQVTSFSGNSYKGYKSREEAEVRWMNYLLEEERKKNPMKTKNRMKTAFVIPSLLTAIAVVLYLFVL
jgi:ribonuclease HI